MRCHGHGWSGLWNGIAQQARPKLIPYLGRLHAEDAAETRVCEIREAAIGEERVVHLYEKQSRRNFVQSNEEMGCECPHLMRQCGRVRVQRSGGWRDVQNLLALLVQSDLVRVVLPVVESLRRGQLTRSNFSADEV